MNTQSFRIGVALMAISSKMAVTELSVEEV